MMNICLLYTSDAADDLVITNFDPNYIPKNYNNIYIFSNLAVQYDLGNIVKILNEIEKTKFEG